MRLKEKLSITSILVIGFLFTACDNKEDVTSNDIVGEYVGTLTSDVADKSIISKSENPATVIVTMVGDKIEAHCFGGNFDTTIILDIYNNGDEINVCFTGEEFEKIYGHMQGQNHMNGNGSQWMQHLNNEHQEGDEHFGGFNMIKHSFDYTFKMENGEFHFYGIKK